MGIAIITGATSGIGAAFAHKLSSLGCSLILVGRREKQLSEVKKSIIASYPDLKIDIVLADLGVSETLEKLCQEWSALNNVEYLINNAGYSEDGEFHEISKDDHKAQMRVHLDATWQFSHAVIPNMLKNKKGTIINVSSVAAYLPTPSSPLYGPTKAFIKNFSETLHLTYRKKGLKIQALCPGFTVTDFHTRMGVDANAFYKKSGPLKAFTAEKVVADSLEYAAKNKWLCVPGSNYKSLVSFAQCAPKSLIHKLLAKGHRSISME